MPRKLNKTKTTKSSKVTESNKLLEGSVLTMKHKGIVDNGRYVETWLTGYSDSQRQLAFAYLWREFNGPNSNKWKNEPRSSLLNINNQEVGYLELKPSSKKQYDKHALEVILTLNESKDGKLVKCSLGFIPRDGGLNRILKQKLQERKLNTPIIIEFTKEAPMKFPQKPLLNVKIAIPYDNTIASKGKLISIDDSNVQYQELNDLLEML